MLLHYLGKLKIQIFCRRGRKCTAVFVNNQHGIQRRGQDFDKKFVFQGVHSKEVDNLTDEFPEESF